MLIRSTDLETTGLPTEEDPQAVCEIGWCDVMDGVVGNPQQQFANPGRMLPPESRAVHHIFDEEVADAPPPEEAMKVLLHPRPNFFAAHNASYELQFYDFDGIPVLCTRKIALRIWPEAPSHALQFLRYWLPLHLDHHKAMPPHRAAPDSYVCAHLLLKILDTGVSFEDLVTWSMEPALHTMINFGKKHKGEKWLDVPADYLEWIRDKSDLDEETKWNAKYWLAEKRECYLQQAEIEAEQYVRSFIEKLQNMLSLNDLYGWASGQAGEMEMYGIVKGTERHSKLSDAYTRRAEELKQTEHGT
ncbi:3'-5' exonuclease [Roseibium sp. Sym1]|uniref:3'-5' exonuclease n=1 Tax=Roseibium sp. Sym1 TaxID=3016006 RepID=UPI0022B3AE13|nr:exonuclease domain-containing protein [Roseibium sp. Sym1]